MTQNCFYFYLGHPDQHVASSVRPTVIIILSDLSLASKESLWIYNILFFDVKSTYFYLYSAIEIISTRQIHMERNYDQMIYIVKKQMMCWALVQLWAVQKRHQPNWWAGGGGHFYLYSK